MELTYTKHGDYYIPDLALPEDTETRSIGIYGQRHKRYLKTHKIVAYTDLLTSGKLHTYLADIDERAREQVKLLMKQLAEKEGITERLKAENQMEWVGRMNNIKACAEEIVHKELIYN